MYPCTVLELFQIPLGAIHFGQLRSLGLLCTSLLCLMLLCGGTPAPFWAPLYPYTFISILYIWYCMIFCTVYWVCNDIISCDNLSIMQEELCIGPMKFITWMMQMSTFGENSVTGVEEITPEQSSLSLTTSFKLFITQMHDCGFSLIGPRQVHVVRNQLQTFVNVSQKTETSTKQIIFISFWTANEMA